MSMIGHRLGEELGQLKTQPIDWLLFIHPAFHFLTLTFESKLIVTFIDAISAFPD